MIKQPQNKRFYYSLILFCIAFFASLYYTQNPFYQNCQRLDSTLYQYIGKLITEGKTPYLDVFDHKGPAIYLWHALGFAINHTWGQWLLELSILLISAFLAFNIATKYISTLFSLLIIGIVFFNIPDSDTLGNTESLAFFLLFLSLNTFITYLQKKEHPLQESFKLGIICGILLLLKPIYLMSVLTFILFILYDFIAHKKYSDLKCHILSFCISFFSIVLILLCWLSIKKALPSFYQEYILFNLEYAKYWQNSNSFHFVFYVFTHHYLTIASLIVAFLLIIFQKKFPKQERTLIWIISITIALTFISILLPNNPFLHYTYTIYPFAFIAFVMITKAFHQNRKTITSILIILFTLSIYNHGLNLFSKISDVESKQAAAVIEHYLDEDETFQTLGWDMARLHLLSQRNAATPYIMAGMLDRLNPQFLYTSLMNIHPKIIALLESTEQLKILDYFWPQFKENYTLVYKNNSYEIYLLNPK